MTRLLRTAVMFAAAASAGCGKGEPPPIHPITGRVTLGGKAYPRLLAYFRPASGVANEFNVGVGETDKDGSLTVRSNTGVGLPAGEYKVTFSCQVPKQPSAAAAKLGPDDKPSEAGVSTVELIPDSHVEGKGTDATPVRFTVTGRGNVLTLDIPAK